jgi:hypothetical protein
MFSLGDVRSHTNIQVPFPVLIQNWKTPIFNPTSEPIGANDSVSNGKWCSLMPMFS